LRRWTKVSGALSTFRTQRETAAASYGHGDGAAGAKGATLLRGDRDRAADGAFGGLRDARNADNLRRNLADARQSEAVLHAACRVTDITWLTATAG
jgi:hypothetical protein